MVLSESLYTGKSVLSVISSRDGVIMIKTLNSKLAAGEILLFDLGNNQTIYGLTMTLLPDQAVIVVFGSDVHINEHTPVYATGKTLSLTVGLHLFGRFLNGLGR